MGGQTIKGVHGSMVHRSGLKPLNLLNLERLNPDQREAFMTPYKGIVRITCRDKTCKNKLTQPVAECVNCDRAKVEILDLENKVIAHSSKLKAHSKEQGAKSLKTTTQKPKATKKAETPEPTV